MSDKENDLLRNIERMCPKDECAEQIAGRHGVTLKRRQLVYDGGNTRVKYTCPVCRQSTFFCLNYRGHVVESSNDCFIATVAYASADAPQVQRLRAYRDQHLMKRPLGRWLVDQYYAWVGPCCATLVAWGGEPAKRAVRCLLNAWVRRLPHHLD